MDTRVQIAYHFKVDPSHLIPGQVRLPDEITRTVSVGEAFSTSKVIVGSLSPEDRAALVVEIEKQTREATRKAKPAGAPTPAGGVDWESKVIEEMSAF